MRPISIFLLAILASAVFAESPIESFGGNVTPVNVEMAARQSAAWSLFYGNAAAPPQEQIVINVTDPSNDTSFSGKLISLMRTSVNYWVADSPSVDWGNLAPANLSEFNAAYGLEGDEQASRLFDGTHNFSITDSFASGGNQWIAGPAASFPGLDAYGNATDSAFREGLFQANSTYVFLVPVSTGALSNGTKYDFVFALPYKRNNPNGTQFYLFSTFRPPAPVTEPTSAPPKKQIDYRYVYNESGLYIFTVPRALVFIQKAGTGVINDNADSEGVMRCTLLPGRYSILIMATGYAQAEGTIELAPIKISDKIVVKVEDGKDKQKDVTIERDGTTELICFGSDCYVRDMVGAVPLSGLECSGSICRYQGDNVLEFVQKYDFKKTNATLTVSQPSTGYAALPADVGKIFSGIGSEISSVLGGGARSKQEEQNQFSALLIIVVFALLAAVFVWRSGIRNKPAMGHD